MVFWVVMIVAVANVSLGFAAAVYLGRRYQRCIVDAIGSSFSAGSFGPDDLLEMDAAFAQPPADGAGATDAAAQRADAAPSTPPETAAEPQSSVPSDAAAEPRSSLVPEAAAEPESSKASEAPAAAESAAPADGAAKAESPEVPKTPAEPEPSAAPETLAGLNGGSRSREGEAPAEPSGTRPVATASAARQEPRAPETTQGYLEAADADEPADVDRPTPRPREGLSQQTVQYDGEKAAPPGVFRIEASAPDSTGVLSYAEPLPMADQENLEPQSLAYGQVQEMYEDWGDRPMVCGSVSPEAEAEKPLLLAATETAKPAGRIEYQAESRLTGVLNRDRLEAELESLRQEDPEHARPLSLALVDLDEFGRVNERYGLEAGNRILRAVAKLLAIESRDRYAVARFSGQRFVILIRDYDVRSATHLVERIRQTIETCEFRYQEFSIRITVSCGVTAAAPPETSESLFARAEESLGEAKRYGRNRTFFREGHYPSPVVPPKHTLRHRVITL